MTIGALLAGNYKTVQKQHWNAIVKSYKKQPDKPDIKYIDLDDKRYKQLTREMERTGIGAQKLFTLMGDKAPEGLTRSMVANIVSRNGIRNVREHYWYAILSTYRSQPTAKTASRPLGTTKTSTRSKPGVR